MVEKGRVTRDAIYERALSNIANISPTFENLSAYVGNSIPLDARNPKKTKISILLSIQKHLPLEVRVFRILSALTIVDPRCVSVSFSDLKAFLLEFDANFLQ